MVRDAVRGYWALASGLTDVTRQRATTAARALVAQGEATAEQVTAIAEDLISTSVTNRAALVGIVRHEIERARTAMGVPTVAELEALTRRLEALEVEVAALRVAAAVTSPAGEAPAKNAPAKKSAAKKSAATTTAAAEKASGDATAPRKRAPRKAPPAVVAAGSDAPA